MNYQKFNIYRQKLLFTWQKRLDAYAKRFVVAEFVGVQKVESNGHLQWLIDENKQFQVVQHELVNGLSGVE